MTQPVQNRPSGAYALTMVGGILATIASIILIIIGALVAGSMYNSHYYYYYDYSGAYLLLGIGIWMLICSIMEIVGAVKLNSNPTDHTKWGVIILVFSILGFVNIFALIGGILALPFKPITSVPQAQDYQTVKRICPKCGRVIDDNTKFCPNCGNQLD